MQCHWSGPDTKYTGAGWGRTRPLWWASSRAAPVAPAPANHLVSVTAIGGRSAVQWCQYTRSLLPLHCHHTSNFGGHHRYGSYWPRFYDILQQYLNLFDILKNNNVNCYFIFCKADRLSILLSDNIQTESIYLLYKNRWTLDCTLGCNESKRHRIQKNYTLKVFRYGPYLGPNTWEWSCKYIATSTLLLLMLVFSLSPYFCICVVHSIVHTVVVVGDHGGRVTRTKRTILRGGLQFCGHRRLNQSLCHRLPPVTPTSWWRMSSCHLLLCHLLLQHSGLWTSPSSAVLLLLHRCQSSSCLIHTKVFVKR